jgi:hypothetical protein
MHLNTLLQESTGSLNIPSVEMDEVASDVSVFFKSTITLSSPTAGASIAYNK